jgi:hypothetical protein
VLAPGRRREVILMDDMVWRALTDTRRHEFSREKVMMDLHVLDLTHRSMLGLKPDTVCDGFVCEDAMRARRCSCWEDVGAGRFVLLVRAHVLAAPCS